MYTHICLKCQKEFISRKKVQYYCSKSCANSISTSKRKKEDLSIYMNGLNPTNAYMLGLIYSDGCISYDKHTKRYRITIALNDIKLMEAIRTMMTPTKKLYEYKHPHGRQVTYSIVSTNPIDIEYLRQLGLSERKSLSIQYPNIGEALDKDFIRGYFDGDGSVYISPTNTYYKGVKKTYTYLCIKITTGSKKFAEQLRERLSEHEILAHIVQDSRKKECYYITIQNKKYIKMFFDFIYSNREIYMERKYNKFLEMI